MSTAFYVSALNQSAALNAAGEYTGSIEVQQSVNESVAGTISLTDAQEGFLFRTTPETGTGNNPLYNTGLEDAQNWTAVAKTVTSNAITSVGDDHTAPMLTVEKELAAAVFGSPELFDLFSNGTVINTSISNAFATMNTAVQNNVTTNASKQYGNAMIRQFPERFALKYNATRASVANTRSVYDAAVIKGVTGVAVAKVIFSTATNLVSITPISTTTNTFTLGEELSITDPTGKTSLQITVPSGSTLWTSTMLTQLNSASGTTVIANASGPGSSTAFVIEPNTNIPGTFTGVTVTQSGSGTGTGALCTMKIDTTTSAITSLFVTTSGANYVKNILTTFTNTDTTPVVWTIPATTSSVVGTNSVQAAILNGNTDSADIEFPTQAGDVLRVMFTITPFSTQTVANSSAFAVMTYKANINYTVGAFGA